MAGRRSRWEWWSGSISGAEGARRWRASLSAAGPGGRFVGECACAWRVAAGGAAVCERGRGWLGACCCEESAYGYSCRVEWTSGGGHRPRVDAAALSERGPAVLVNAGWTSGGGHEAPLLRGSGARGCEWTSEGGYGVVERCCIVEEFGCTVGSCCGTGFDGLDGVCCCSQVRSRSLPSTTTCAR